MSLSNIIKYKDHENDYFLDFIIFSKLTLTEIYYKRQYNQINIFSVLIIGCTKIKYTQIHYFLNVILSITPLPTLICRDDLIIYLIMKIKVVRALTLW